MNKHSDELRRCLVNLDVAAMRRLAAHLWPHFDPARTDAEVLATMHHARTQTESVPLRCRAYSHRWLTERALPSGLPDKLRPAAERMYPQIVSAVGISVRSRSLEFAPVARLVQNAMSDKVAELYADGVTDPAIVKPEMFRAREVTLSKLLGTTPSMPGLLDH